MKTAKTENGLGWLWNASHNVTTDDIIGRRASRFEIARNARSVVGCRRRCKQARAYSKKACAMRDVERPAGFILIANGWPRNFSHSCQVQQETGDLFASLKSRR
eukprot:scaffold7341_cov229-Pinguiococcus_pyrenoidosus.AAC.15